MLSEVAYLEQAVTEPQRLESAARRLTAALSLLTYSLSSAKSACEAIATAGTRVSAHLCDVANEAQVLAFRDAALAVHERDHIDLLFNNAGVGGGGSFIADPREQWERTFNVCWFGVYYCTRAFLPLLIASRESCIVNTSSINAVFAIEPPTSCLTVCAVRGSSSPRR